MDSLSLYLYSHGFSQCWLHKDFHIYFPFCWNSGIHIKYVKQKIVQPSLCRGLRGALWAPLSPLHNDIWVLTIVKTFIIILINESPKTPYSSAGARMRARTTGKFYKILHTISVFTKHSKIPLGLHSYLVFNPLGVQCHLAFVRTWLTFASRAWRASFWRKSLNPPLGLSPL